MIKSFKEGSVLIFTLWIILLLTLFALGLSYRARVELKSISYDIDELKAHYLCKSAAKWLIKTLKVEYKGYDAKSDLIGYSVSNYILGKGKFEIENVEDEESKINLNEVPVEILLNISSISSSSIIQNIQKYRPFKNLETLILIEGIDEEILRNLSNEWLTVYGNGKINFNTTDYYIIDIFKSLPGIKVSKLKSNICNVLNGKFGCCKYSDVETLSVSAKNSVFESVRNVKNNNDFFRNIQQLENKIYNTDIIKQNKKNIKNTLQSNLYNCCMDNYDAIDKAVYCKRWALNESGSIVEKIFSDYILDVIFEYIDVKSNNYKADIIASINNLEKHVTVVVDRFNEKIRYWYSHYYNEYED